MTLPKLNLTYYSGKDLYSDGAIEDEILSIVKNTADYTKILADDNRWPVLYHLSPVRRNLLEWYEFDTDAALLEIGAGCGALTGLFCEKNKEVAAVELSKRRADIIANRHRERSNLEIIVGNLNDIEFDRKFDYITLIGVLEYAGKFTATKNPYHDFLRQVKSYLKPDGTLIIAIENKFGLKYWAGAKEDHTNSYFDSIENYLADCGVRTFGKAELQELVNAAGFSTVNFHYPMPDYKLPLQLFSDEYLPRIGQIGGHFPNYDNDRYVLFNEKTAFDNLILNKQFDFFANSFLLFCTNGDRPAKTVYSKFNRDRLPRFQTETSIYRVGTGLKTVKKPLTAEAGKHIGQIRDNYELLRRSYRGGKAAIAAAAEACGTVTIDFIEGKGFDTVLIDAVLHRDVAGFYSLFDRYVDFVRQLSPSPGNEIAQSAASHAIFGEAPALPGVDLAAIANIDVTLENIMVKSDDAYAIIDYEWVFDCPIPVNFIIYRSIRKFWCTYAEYLGTVVQQPELLARYRIGDDEMKVYDRMEKSFQAYVNGKNEDYKIKSGYLKPVTVFRAHSTYAVKDIVKRPKLLFRKRKK